MFLPPSPLPKTTPAAGRFRLPLTPFSIRFLPYPSRAATTRRRTATATGDAPLLQIMDWGPAGPVDHLPGVSTPHRESHDRGRPRRPLRPLLLPAASPIPTVPFDRDRAEPIGTPILRPPSTPGDTPAALKKLGYLDDVDELQIADSVARFSHADWKREHQIAPTCHAEVRYTTIGRPPAHSPDFLSCYPSHKRSHPGADK